MFLLLFRDAESLVRDGNNGIRRSSMQTGVLQPYQYFVLRLIEPIQMNRSDRDFSGARAEFNCIVNNVDKRS